MLKTDKFNLCILLSVVTLVAFLFVGNFIPGLRGEYFFLQKNGWVTFLLFIIGFLAIGILLGVIIGRQFYLGRSIKPNELKDGKYAGIIISRESPALVKIFAKEEEGKGLIKSRPITAILNDLERMCANKFTDGYLVEDNATDSLRISEAPKSPMLQVLNIKTVTCAKPSWLQ